MVHGLRVLQLARNSYLTYQSGIAYQILLKNISFQFQKQFLNNCDHFKNKACISPQVVCKAVKRDKSGLRTHLSVQKCNISQITRLASISKAQQHSKCKHNDTGSAQPNKYIFKNNTQVIYKVMFVENLY